MFDSCGKDVGGGRGGGSSLRSVGWDGVLVITYLTNSDFLGVMAR